MFQQNKSLDQQNRLMKEREVSISQLPQADATIVFQLAHEEVICVWTVAADSEELF
jgi:hypothetical protein